MSKRTLNNPKLRVINTRQNYWRYHKHYQDVQHRAESLRLVIFTLMLVLFIQHSSAKKTFIICIVFFHLSSVFMIAKSLTWRNLCGGKNTQRRLDSLSSFSRMRCIFLLAWLCYSGGFVPLFCLFFKMSLHPVQPISFLAIIYIEIPNFTLIASTVLDLIWCVSHVLNWFVYI